LNSVPSSGAIRPVSLSQAPSRALSLGEPINLSSSPADSSSPALVVSDDAIHVVWEEGGRICHRFWDGRTWSLVRRVAVGEQPALAVDGHGLVHLVFVNEFGSNYEVYYCRWNGSAWSLPRNLSNTTGVSSAPGVAVQDDGAVHAVWADNTPGYSVIYHASWDGTYWINEPIPSAFGGAPRMVAGAGAALHVVWQDRDSPALPYETYYSYWNGTAWSLPENLSDTAEEPSIIPALAVDGSGIAHVVWQERSDGRYAVEYTWGTVGYWSIPMRLSEGDAQAYLPSPAVGRRSTVFVGWDLGTAAVIRERSAAGAAWSTPLTVMEDPTGVSDLQLAVDGSGQLVAVWVQRPAGDNWDIFCQMLTHKVALPLVLRAG